MKKTRVMVFGTFDGLHLGHLNMLEQARKLSNETYLIVSIARDVNVFKIKGHKTSFNEVERLNFIKKNNLSDKVVLAGKTNYLVHILKEKPDIIALGYDQKAYVKELRNDLKERDSNIKIVRLKPYKNKIYKTHLLRQ